MVARTREPYETIVQLVPAGAGWFCRYYPTGNEFSWRAVACWALCGDGEVRPIVAVSGHLLGPAKNAACDLHHTVNGEVEGPDHEEQARVNWLPERISRAQRELREAIAEAREATAAFANVPDLAETLRDAERDLEALEKVIKR